MDLIHLMPVELTMPERCCSEKDFTAIFLKSNQVSNRPLQIAVYRAKPSGHWSYLQKKKKSYKPEINIRTKASEFGFDINVAAKQCNSNGNTPLCRVVLENTV